MTPNANSPSLEMINISKTFGGAVHALVGVDFCVQPGEIHALLGENGAGKSTLMNVLGGVVAGDEGEVRRFGKVISIRNSHDARERNISFIHQELNLVPDLAVYENIFLGEELTRRNGLLDRRRMIEETAALMERLDIRVSPTAVVRELGATMKQVVEIAGAVRQDSDLIIMDEPTTSLTDHEIEHLFEIMRSLKRQGVSIIFISHKLKEVFSVCDRYTVLRDGRLAGAGTVSDTTEEQIVQLMVGRALSDHEFYEQREIGGNVLEARSLTLSGCYEDVTFSIRSGEIVGFTGLAGDGRSELFQTVFGYRQPESGQVVVNGSNVHVNHPTTAVAHGLGYAPKDRKENAIVRDLGIAGNVSLPSLKRFRKGALIDRKVELASVKIHADRMKLRYHRLTDLITMLSGGNQQKVVLAKWLEADSDVIILDNPTQGIDVGAKSEIYELMMELASAGKAIVVLTSEFAEIMRLCDRVYVMFHGRLTGEIPRERATEEELMLYSTGVKNDAVVVAKE